LTAPAAWGYEFTFRRYSDHSNFIQLSCSESTLQRANFGANAQTVGRIFHVGRSKDASVFRQDGGADREIGIGRVSMRGSIRSGFQKCNRRFDEVSMPSKRVKLEGIASGLSPVSRNGFVLIQDDAKLGS